MSNANRPSDAVTATVLGSGAPPHAPIGNELPPPPKLDGYEFNGLLGRGGMGLVWRGRDVLLQRDVAIKVLKLVNASNAARGGRNVEGDRLLDEARAAARLNHPNTVTVHQVISQDGQLHVIMELIDGGSLADHVSTSGPMPWREATRAIRDAAAGLAAAHEAGLVHRDVKPSNLMRSSRGVIKVVDFGLARTQSPSDAAHTGSIVGTPAYMSPEQCRGAHADARSDVYALGCSFYTLLTGRLPFEGQSVEVILERHRSDPLPEVRKLVSDVPETIASILRRSAAKSADERFQSAGEFIQALDEALSEAAHSLPSFADLPIELTSFVGRTKEIQSVRELLQDTIRMVTLSGAGGSGKTRLSLRIAAETRDHFANGMCLVELAPLNDPALIPQAVAAALRIGENAGTSVPEAIIRGIGDRQILLILDNCEHLIEASAQLASTLLQACANLKILATSREALNVAGEFVFQVPPLGVPDDSMAFSPQHTEEFDAVRLFVERARSVLSSFRLDAETAPTVAQICRRLDGIPLAIELAAARVKLLSPRQIAERLNDRFQLLTSGSRSALPRQRTLLATIDWSYDLLSPEEQRLLRELSIFAGGWTLEAAEAVCAECGDVLELSSRLADKSLVTVGAAVSKDVEPRYGMLETVRQYASQKLESAAQTAAARVRHQRYFAEFAERAVPHFYGRTISVWLARLRADHDNLRAALDVRADADPGVVETALNTAGALHFFWSFGDLSGEGTAKLKQLLALPAAARKTRGRAWALSAWGHLGGPSAASFEASDFFHETGDLIQEALSLHVGAYYERNLQESYSLQKRSLDLFRQLGASWGVSLALRAIGELAVRGAAPGKPQELFEEAISAARKSGMIVGYSETLHHLASVLRNSDRKRSVELEEEGLRVAQSMGHIGREIVHLSELANLARMDGDERSAEELVIRAKARAKGRSKTGNPSGVAGLWEAVELIESGDTKMGGSLLEEIERNVADISPEFLYLLLAFRGAAALIAGAIEPSPAGRAFPRWSDEMLRLYRAASRANRRSIPPAASELREARGILDRRQGRRRLVPDRTGRRGSGAGRSRRRRHIAGRHPGHVQDR